MRKAEVRFDSKLAGYIIQDSNGYEFSYTDEYFNNKSTNSISITLPKSQKSYRSKYLFPFFDGLIPEGWLLHIAEKNWKLNPRDRMGLLLTCCEDCIGAVTIHAVEVENE